MDWEQLYIDNHTPWDKNAPAPILAELLEKRRAIFNRVENALVPGCGTGHDCSLLASHGIKNTGFDISSSALAEAEANYPNELITWQQGDLFCDLPEQAYDMVWEHTCYCALDPKLRAEYVENMANTLKVRGFLLGIFFIDTGMAENEGPPFRTSVSSLKEHFLKHFSLEYEMKPEVAYQGREGCEHLMLWRRLDTCLD